MGKSSSPGRVKNFLHIAQNGRGAHPVFYAMSTGGSFLGVKRSGREADHACPTSAEVKKTFPPTSSWHSFIVIIFGMLGVKCPRRTILVGFFLICAFCRLVVENVEGGS
jgi:hypothetical protein